MPHLLITGSTGFLGTYILTAHRAADWEITSLGRRKPAGVDHHIFSDLMEIPELTLEARYDRVIHLAGKAHVVPRTPEERVEFDRVNARGTEYLVKALQNLRHQPLSIVYASTVAVYGLNQGKDIKESTKLQPKTAYGHSKLAGERFLQEYTTKTAVPLLILRFPLIAGPDAPGNLGEMWRAFSNNHYVGVSNNNTPKSMVWAADVATWLTDLPLAAKGVFHLTDGQHPTFRQLENCFASLSGHQPRLTLPLFLLKVTSKLGDALARLNIRFPLTSGRLKKLTSPLTFNDDRARRELHWRGRPVIDHYLAQKKAI